MDGFHIELLMNTVVSIKSPCEKRQRLIIFQQSTSIQCAGAGLARLGEFEYAVQQKNLTGSLDPEIATRRRTNGRAIENVVQHESQLETAVET